MNWTESDCTQIIAMEGDFPDATFTRCQLNRAAFIGSRLVRARFLACTLDEAQCAHSDFTMASLAGASMHKANMAYATLSHADCTKCDATMADFSHAKLERTDFSGAILTLANVHAADITRAETAHATLTGLRTTDQALLRAETFVPRAE